MTQNTRLRLRRALIVSAAALLLPALFALRSSDAAIGQSQATARQQLHRRLAEFHAPIVFQDTETRGDSQDEGGRLGAGHPLHRRGDFLSRFDFDGDWNGLNNWASFARRPPADHRRDEMARAYLYYSVVETATHYLINYCVFHAQDREPQCSDGECHENDLEGGLHLVKKGPENGGLGTLWLMMYLAHDNWCTYLTPAGHAAGIRRGGRPPHETPEKAHHYNADFIYDVVWRGVTPEGKLFTPRDPHQPSDPSAPPGTIFRPTVWSEPWGHGMNGWPGPDAKSPYDRYRKPEYPWRNGFINGDGVIYYPGAQAGIPDYRKEVDIVPYALLDIFAPGGLWERRERVIDRNMDGCGGGARGTPDCAWGYFGTFRGERWGTDKANAPWRWDHNDDHLPPGMQAFDPLRLIEEYNNLSAVPADQLRRAYIDNRYVGLPSGTRPNRLRPQANAGARVVVVKPGEPFILDGSRSRTGDLDGRGHLLYRWEAEGWESEGWSQPWLWQTLAREGTHRVKLTVNDGDHEASDEARVVVTARKLFFDDFQAASPQAGWRFLGQTWQQRDGSLWMRRPGGGLNAALVTDREFSARAYPQEVTVETLLRLDLLYPEASAPFGVGVAYAHADGQSALLFGFAGTRRFDAQRDSARRHLTEVAFYEVTPQRRGRVGNQILTFSEGAAKGYRLGQWYFVKLAVADGREAKAKVWPFGAAEPDWMYHLTLDPPKRGALLPLLAAGTGTNGEAAFDYFLVLSGQ
jgi:hypothetical protein